MNLRLRTIVSLVLMSILLLIAVSPTFAQVSRVDTDGDGVPNKTDNCPNQRGPASNHGCPKPDDQPQPTNDKDGDGTLDDADRCPLDGGPSWNAGCPTNGTPNPGTDKDGDGIADSSDGCPDQPGTAANGGCLPVLAGSGPCVLATKGNQNVNIRVLPAVQRAIIAVLSPDSTLPVLDKLLTEDGDWFFTGEGWVAARVIRLGGDCDPIGTGTPVELCSLLTDLTLNSLDALRKAGFDGKCRADTGELVPAVIPACDGSVKPGELLPAVEPGDGSVKPGELLPAVEPGDGSVKPGELLPAVIPACDGSVIPACDGSVKPGELLPAVEPGDGSVVPGDGSVKPGELLPAVEPGDGSVRPGELLPAVIPACDGSVVPSEKTCDGSVMPVDFNGDGVPDAVSGGGAGDVPFVKITDGSTHSLLLNFFAYDPQFKGGISVSVGDVNGDGVPEVITGAGAGGGPHVKVFDGKTLAPSASFFAFNPAFTGGVRVSVGDVNGDCVADIITQVDSNGQTHTRAFDGKSLQILSDTLA
ncbi:MAG: VCBS repeat-containing protein [Chloroflexota bacterium]